MRGLLRLHVGCRHAAGRPPRCDAPLLFCTPLRSRRRPVNCAQSLERPAHLEADRITSALGSRGVAIAVTQPLWPFREARCVRVSAMVPAAARRRAAREERRVSVRARASDLSGAKVQKRFMAAQNSPAAFAAHLLVACGELCHLRAPLRLDNTTKHARNAASQSARRRGARPPAEAGALGGAERPFSAHLCRVVNVTSSCKQKGPEGSVGPAKSDAAPGQSSGRCSAAVPWTRSAHAAVWAAGEVSGQGVSRAPQTTPIALPLTSKPALTMSLRTRAFETRACNGGPTAHHPRGPPKHPGGPAGTATRL